MKLINALSSQLRADSPKATGAHMHVRFVKSAGRYLGQFHAKIATDLIEAVAKSGILIDGLVVSVHDDIVCAEGVASSQADKEKCILILGNTRGCAGVTDDIHVEVEEPRSRFHTVLEGETLSSIARSNYGVMRLTEPIVEANSPMLDRLTPGLVLRVPPVDPPLHAVGPGETLGAISRHWYGTPSMYRAIFEANLDQLSTPDRIVAGQDLRIPVYFRGADATD